MRRFLYFIPSFLLFSCTISKSTTTVKNTADDSSFLKHLMQTRIDQFADLLSNKNKNNIQIVYTQINRDSVGKAHLHHYFYYADSSSYFYPASTVKLPAALLAIEKFNLMHKPGVDKYTAAQSVGDNVISSIALDAKEVFLISDNQAFNRLYEFLGQAYIHQKLTQKGYPGTIIRHRLERSLTDEENRTTPEIFFYGKDGQIIFDQVAEKSNSVFYEPAIELGKGYLDGKGNLVNKPFDFTYKNRMPLYDLHRMLESVIFPEAYADSARFLFTNDDRNYILRWLSSYPRESGNPIYDTIDYYDNYCKFLMTGCSSKKQLPSYIRIFNKVGDAYGFLTDVAYIVDYKHKIEFMLSATIACNSDGIFNDDKYDYDSDGYPFMNNLGNLIYDYELKRKRKYLPDLSSVNFDHTPEKRNK